MNATHAVAKRYIAIAERIRSLGSHGIAHRNAVARCIQEPLAHRNWRARVRTLIACAHLLGLLLFATQTFAAPNGWVGPKCFSDGLLQRSGGRVQGSCRVRSGPGIGYDIVATLDARRTYAIIGAPEGENGWVHISLDSGNSPSPSNLPSSASPSLQSDESASDASASPSRVLKWIVGVVLAVGVLYAIGRNRSPSRKTSASVSPVGRSSSEGHYSGPDAMICTSCGMFRRPNSSMTCSCGGTLGSGGEGAKRLLRR